MHAKDMSESAFETYLFEDCHIMRDTIKQYKRDLAILANHVGKPLPKITHEDLVMHLSWMRSMYKETTVAAKMAAYKNYFVWIGATHVIDPIEYKWPLVSERPDPETLSEEQLDRLLDRLSYDPKLLVIAGQLLSGMGMREITAHAGVSRQTIHTWLSVHGITPRVLKNTGKVRRHA